MPVKIFPQTLMLACKRVSNSPSTILEGIQSGRIGRTKPLAMTTARRSLMSHQERRRIARELHDGGPSASPFRLPLPFLPCRANLRFRATAQERRSPLSDSPGGKATSISAVPEPEPGVRSLLVCGVLVVALFV